MKFDTDELVSIIQQIKNDFSGHVDKNDILLGFTQFITQYNLK